MPERISAWGLYDVFTVKNGEQIFLAAVSDAQWVTFCDAFGFTDLKADPALATNNDRVRQRSTLLVDLRKRLVAYSTAELTTIFETKGLPFAPILRPEELYDDEHLLATGGLADVVLPDGKLAGTTAKTTLFPFTMDGLRLGVRLNPPTKGEHTQSLLEGLGLDAAHIEALKAQGAVA